MTSSHSSLQEALDLLNAKKYEKARQKFTALAEHGSVDAYIYLGWIYQSGSGVEINLNQAMKYYELAYRGGAIPAGHYLGTLHRSMGDYAQALLCFEDSANLGYLPSNYWAGIMFLNGEGADVDLEKAHAYLKAASDLGHFFATRDLAKCEIKGVFGERRIGHGVWMLIRSVITGIFASIKNPKDERLM